MEWKYNFKISWFKKYTIIIYYIINYNINIHTHYNIITILL